MWKWLLQIWSRRTILERGIFISALATCALIVCFRIPSEPSLHRRTLREWLDIYARERSEESRAAIEKIGVDAIPFLLTAYAPWTNYHATSRVEYFFRQIADERARQRRPTAEQAHLAFSVLGPKAKSAIPSLLAQIDAGPGRARSIVEALEQIEPNRDRLYHALLKKSQKKRTIVVDWILRGDTRGELTNLMRELIVDPNWQIRQLAYIALLNTHLGVNDRQSTLMAMLVDKDFSVVNAALQEVTINRDQLWLVLPQVRALTNSVRCRTNALCALRAARLLPKGAVSDYLVAEQKTRINVRPGRRYDINGER